MRNQIIIINGPTGVGKTTVIKQLVEELPQLHTGVTFTTRDLRPKDKEDKVMYHITKEEFKIKIADGELLEWAEFSGNYYGTAKAENLAILADHPLLLNVEVIGTFKIKDLYPDTLTIYIMPENIDQLKSRLEQRTFTSEQRAERIESAKKSMNQADRYDHQVINKEGDVAGTVAKIKEIILNEAHI